MLTEVWVYVGLCMFSFIILLCIYLFLSRYLLCLLVYVAMFLYWFIVKILNSFLLWFIIEIHTGQIQQVF